MDYEILNSKLNSGASVKIGSIPYITLILSVAFIPAAYVTVAAVFVAHWSNKDMFFISRDYEFKMLKVYIFMGVLFSQFKAISFVYAIIYILCLFSYYMFFESMSEEEAVKLKKIIYIVSIIAFFIGIIQYFNPGFSIPGKWVDANQFKLNKRIYSTFFNPNIFGFYINLLIISACGNLDFKKINLSLAVFLTGISCLFLTFSRTSWISLIASLLIASIFNKKYLKYAAIVSAVMFGMDYVFGIGRLNPSSAASDSSFLYRIEIWKACIQIIKDNPLTGIGFGTLFKHISAYSTVVKTNIEHCHNIYIQSLTETGIIGFGIFLFIIFKSAATIIKNIKTAQDNQIWITAFIILSMALIHGLVDSVLLTPQILLIMSMYAGTLKAIKNEELRMKNFK
ncbi:O-antigen ligase family protein [Sedimentibacter saalensis]|uniref:O-antigen ligase n=1 Tax=Sedimentibacter saalensis TaxID=130788 RepID=A0A562JK50_9FIRM|nr:O-antigen ligase family protein [Sedimentibacter saalensis]TWH83539.1 O-antigen ligase [Sedimentibacter saalensis]